MFVVYKKKFYLKYVEKFYLGVKFKYNNKL